MTVYYPGYTYLFATCGENQPAPYFRRLRKKYIRAVLQDLHDIAHHVYILLENLPENRFVIVRYNDHVRQIIRPDTALESDSFTIGSFYQHFDSLHEFDEFRVRFYTEVFYYEQSFTSHTLEIVYRHYLKYLCQEKLRNNAPVCLTTELIRSYGLTETDAKKACAYIHEYNADIAADVQAEYNALSNLECIKK